MIVLASPNTLIGLTPRVQMHTAVWGAAGSYEFTEMPHFSLHPNPCDCLRACAHGTRVNVGCAFKGSFGCVHYAKKKGQPDTSYAIKEISLYGNTSLGKNDGTCIYFFFSVQKCMLLLSLCSVSSNKEGRRRNVQDPCSGVPSMICIYGFIIC